LNINPLSSPRSFVDKFAASCQSKQKGRILPNLSLTPNQGLQIPGGNFCDKSAKSGHEIVKLAVEPSTVNEDWN